jgi:hypothetical protein
MVKMQFKAWFKHKTADKVLASLRHCIVDIIEPNTLKGRISIELGEFISGHYTKFKTFKKWDVSPFFPHKQSLK